MTTSDKPVLEVRDLGIDFGGLTAVNKFNITVGKTDIVGLIGPNGAGKTTVFNMLTKVYTPSRGTILVNGENTEKMTTIDVSKAGVARTFQNIRLFSNLSVEDNVKIGMHNEIGYNTFEGILRTKKYYEQEKAAHEKAIELLKIFNLDQSADIPAKSLPYGAQRRLEIARALAASPRYILLDEPFTGIDPIAIQEIQTHIRKLTEKNIGVLITDHNPKATLSITDRVNLIFDGKIKISGNSKDVANNPDAKKFYLGEDFTL